MFCGKCGAQNPDNAAFCKGCGTQLNTIPKTTDNGIAKTPANVHGTGLRKRKPALTTRKTSSIYLIPQIISDVIFVALAIYLLARGAELIDSFWYRSDGEKLQLLGYVCLLTGLIPSLYHGMVSRTYADVFNGRIVGTGMQGIQLKSFSLRFDQITDVSVSKGFLNFESGAGLFLIINTTGGEYNIITTTDRANEIAAYYARVMRQARAYQKR